MSTIQVKDALGVIKYYRTLGEGNETNPFKSVPADFYLEVSKGNIEGHKIQHVVGLNPEIDNDNNTNEIEDIWEQGGIWTPPTTARIHDIVSDSINDTLAGTGARVIRIYGLDSSFDEITEDINMNGTTNVPTVNAYTRINKMICLSAGSLEYNAGKITATAQVDGTITNLINVDPSFGIGKGSSLSAIFTVPNGKTAFMFRGSVSITRAGAPAGAMTQLRMLIKPNVDVSTSPYLTVWQDSLAVDGTSFKSFPYTLPPKFDEKTDITIRSLSVTDDDTRVGASYDLLLVDNPTP